VPEGAVFQSPYFQVFTAFLIALTATLPFYRKFLTELRKLIVELRLLVCELRKFRNSLAKQPKDRAKPSSTDQAKLAQGKKQKRAIAEARDG